MKKYVILIIIMLLIGSRPATSDIITNQRRRLLPAYIDAQRRQAMGLSIPLRWAPEVKAWEDRVGLPLRGQVNPYTNIKERSLLAGETTPLAGETAPPEPAVTLLYFQDKSGVIYSLSLEVYDHIVVDHNIADPSSFIEEILMDPRKIVNDKKNPDRQIYYRQYKKPGKKYRGVVVGTVDREIKTVYISDKKP